jgi:hypothetical protein
LQVRAKVAAMRHRRQDRTANLRQLLRLVLLTGLGGCGQAGSQAPVAPVMTDLAAQDLAAPVKAAGLETQASGDGHAAQVIAPVPSKPRSREYVGSEVCRSCHQAKHQAWSQDWHQRALTVATVKFVVGNFSGAHFAGTSSEAQPELATERFSEILAYDRHHKGAQQRLLQLSSLTAGKR